ncbi:MAG: sigma 54-interacting transcriptional regulator [Deltaproteobacteria bacterium]|nr:sigma 54-interacting transcriptional regulator [Deltaproteobacteria bacterium]
MSKAPAGGVKPSTTTDAGSTTGKLGGRIDPPPATPGLLLAWKPDDVAAAERARLDRPLLVGRSGDASWTVLDRKMSKEHFAVAPEGGTCVIRDLGSTNGTLVNGAPLGGARPLADQDVVRAGRCLFVFNGDVARLGAEAAASSTAMGLAGPFHSPFLVSEAAAAVRTGRHLVLEGESGTGKELLARAVHQLGAAATPFVAHNCAGFASTEDAQTTLFGVVRGAFTGVEARAGLLERADGGVLYLDEVHNLPLRVQRALLRFAEDGCFTRIGESAQRRANVRLVLGTNRPVEWAMAEGVLADDLVARTHRLRVPPLRERRADVPGIFRVAMERACARCGASAMGLSAVLGPDHHELLLLHDFTGTNVRAIEDLAATIAARAGGQPAAAAQRQVDGLFAERFAGSPVFARQRAPGDAPALAPGSSYERHREQIVAVFRECGGNLTATESALRERGLALHRRWLSEFLERWGVRKRWSKRQPGG